MGNELERVLKGDLMKKSFQLIKKNLNQFARAQKKEEEFGLKYRKLSSTIDEYVCIQ